MAATFSGKSVGLNVLKFPVNNEKELLFAVREQINSYGQGSVKIST